MHRLWSVETTAGEDVSWFVLCAFALLTIHWSVALGLWILHFMFTQPKDNGIPM